VRVNGMSQILWLSVVAWQRPSLGESTHSRQLGCPTATP
jgi:hypothetical protein